ncbi:MAG: RCC1 repeat-containing protein, partial [Gemmatimonadetes bacterium]|nr:RCC1 repeat-containing protein [Gemmatimonadota bacterium]
ALTSAGEAYCWGYNILGQLGDGSNTTRTMPVAVSGGLNFSALAPGGVHTSALTTSGAAYCWGSSNEGQLGRGTFGYSTVPVAVAPFTAGALGSY